MNSGSLQAGGALAKDRSKTMARKSVVFILAAALSAGLYAQTPATPPADTPPATSEAIYGYQLMTEPERLEYRARMRTLKTAEEREAFRMEHHKLMQERAKMRGITLPEAPPPRGMGAGQGMGRGMGPGRGQGAAQGGGQKQKRGAGAPPANPPPGNR
jgi:hypothetical protein